MSYKQPSEGFKIYWAMKRLVSTLARLKSGIPLINYEYSPLTTNNPAVFIALFKRF